MSARPEVLRKFGRHKVNCDAMLAFPARQARPRVKGQLVQIGKGGCAFTTQEKLFIGEECLVWALIGGHKYLGVAGRIVWTNPVYQGQPITIVGIEFKSPVDLSAELVERLVQKP